MKPLAEVLGRFVDIKNISSVREGEILNALTRTDTYYYDVPGWGHGKPFWIDISDIRLKNADGTENNSIRLGGTGDQEGLESDVSKGLKTSVPLCAVYIDPDPDVEYVVQLLDWFNRVKEFKRQGYKRLPVVPYFRDNPTEFQLTLQDAIDDFRAVANRGTGQKVITEKEILELLRKRFSTYPLNGLKDRMVRYLTQLDLGLSGQEIKGKCNTVLRERERLGNIEYFSRKDAEDFNDNWWEEYSSEGKWDAKPSLVNASDSTRALRLWIQIMNYYVETGEIFNFMSFHSGATQHADIDDGLKELKEELRELQMTTIKYVNRYNHEFGADHVRPTWDHIGSIPQKIEDDGTKRTNWCGFQD